MTAMRVIFFAVLTAWVAGCTSPKKTEPAPERLTLAGHVLTTDGAKLPADAVLTVRLLDVSAPDEPAVVLAEQSIAAPGTPPIAFSLRYRPAEAARGHRFVLDARIEVSGKLSYYSTHTQPVKLDGSEGGQELTVAPAR